MTKENMTNEENQNTNPFDNPKYIKQAGEIINTAGQAQVVQLENGDIIVAEKALIETTYCWNEESSRFERSTKIKSSI